MLADVQVPAQLEVQVPAQLDVRAGSCSPGLCLSSAQLQSCHEKLHCCVPSVPRRRRQGWWLPRCANKHRQINSELPAASIQGHTNQPREQGRGWAGGLSLLARLGGE